MNTNIFKSNSESTQVDTRKKTLKIKPSMINEHFQCGICQGYIIDATTITDCLHSFCKSCIVHFLKTIDRRCPTCNINLKGSLELCLKSDSFLQRLIYLLIPNLLVNEIERRDRFYFNENLNTELIINNKTLLNVKLASVQSQNKNSDLNKFEKENQKQPEENTTHSNTKYIQCIAQTPVGILSKLIRNKYDIPLDYKIKLTYRGHPLDDTESLIQVFTSFLLNKDDLVQINYEIKKKKKLFKNVKKSIENVCDRSSKENSNASLNLQKSKLKPSGSQATQKSQVFSNKNTSSNSAPSSSNKPFLSAKKMSLVSDSIQNENNLLARFRPIRKKDPVEITRNSSGTSLNILSPVKGEYFLN